MTKETTVAARLRLSKTRPADMTPPPGPGIYAIFVDGIDSIGEVVANDDGLVYVGKAADGLASRLRRKHFKTGKTSSSTLRRAVGALLKNELDLVAIPRAPRRTTKDIQQYRFEADGEERLTNWMEQHLLVGHHAVDEDVAAVEKAAIAFLKPPLNMTYWKNPQRAVLDTSRGVCRSEARLKQG